MNITLLSFVGFLLIAFFVVLGFWRARAATRTIQDRYQRIYSKIPPSTVVRLTDREKRSYRFVGVAALIVWFAGMSAFIIPRGIAIYPFYLDHVEEIPVTVVDQREVRLTNKGVSYYRFILSAEVEGEIVEDSWTVAPNWFTSHQGDVVPGLMYREGGVVQLGIASAITPVFSWQQIVGMMGVTAMVWVLAARQFQLAKSENTKFGRLALIDKERRAKSEK